MIINYPSNYLIPVSIIALDEDEYNNENNDEYNFRTKDEDDFRCNIEENEGDITYIDVNKDIFQEIDEEYVNESAK